MKTHPPNLHPPGYISTLMVLTTCVFLTTLMVITYKRAITSHQVQSGVQLQIDYAEKEEAILRSIMSIAPNRAIRAMQHRSNYSISLSNPLRWENIFSEALAMANARQSISSAVIESLGQQNLKSANSGDSAVGNVALVFNAIGGESGFVSSGLNRSLGSGYPLPLSCNQSTDASRDATWPIISNRKIFGNLAQGTAQLPVDAYPGFNIIGYPDINFGYAHPGQPFVAKRNWWAFSLDLARHDSTLTHASISKRDFVLSIYEIPSQLPISASSFMTLGQHENGSAWEDINIAGGVFGGRVVVEGDTALTALATRRGASLSSGTTVGGSNFVGDPLAPGVREAFQLTQGAFFPVSLASESGRAAFVPINRGVDYFDRLSHSAESSTLSSTTWNNYSIGALQCAMRLDVTDSVSSTNKTPTALRFSYLKNGVRQEVPLSLINGPVTGLPPGYIFSCNENQTYDFGTTVVDVAYGKDGVFAFQSGVTGSITFNNARFGDPLVGVFKAGYFRPSFPFEIKALPDGKTCVAIYPKRFPAFLTSLRADSTAINSSLVVNVDYTAATGSLRLSKPSIPCTDLDYGLILEECDDLTPFTKGFSLVTNLRLYIGDDFNTSPATPPTGYTPTGQFFPPCSLFAPEKRYGVQADPFAIIQSGQIGSLASETANTPVHPVDAKTRTGNNLAASRIHMNLRPITHPAELPPITMMNWLVLVEERKQTYFSAN